MIVYIVAVHNNSIILLVFGLPFDRTLPWHKLLAFASIFSSLIHGASFYVGGRAQTMRYAAGVHHHIFHGVSKAYGMECTGERLSTACFASVVRDAFRHSLLCSRLDSLVESTAKSTSGKRWCHRQRRQLPDVHDWLECLTQCDLSVVLAGWGLLASMVVMSVVAIPWVTKQSFPAFYRVHILFALATFVLALWHGFGSAAWHGYAPASVPGAIFWIADLVVRAFFLNSASSSMCRNGELACAVFDVTKLASTQQSLRAVAASTCTITLARQRCSLRCRLDRDKHSAAARDTWH